MKKFLVKFNFPVHIDNGTIEGCIYQDVYGFIAPYDENDREQNAITEKNIRSYIGYLASMHEWSNNWDEREFTLSPDRNWIDKDGIVHLANLDTDDWTSELCQRCKDMLGLDYTLYVVDWDEIEGFCLSCGMDGGFIICESLMDYMLSFAEEERVVILFNHPVWLPKNLLWEGEEGFCHIYGLAPEEEIDSELLQDCKDYLGYLAMVEECVLNGHTPSGYKAKLEEDGKHWFSQGETYSYLSKEIRAEGSLCKKKHNYRFHGVLVRIPREHLLQGTKGGLIISQELYELLLDNIIG